MQYLPLLIGVACAVFFHRAAYHEHMRPWPWTLASITAALVVSSRTPGIAATLGAQAALFVIMWWYNFRRQSRR